MEHRPLPALVTLETSRPTVLAVGGPLLLIIDCVLLVHLPSETFANRLTAMAVQVLPAINAVCLMPNVKELVTVYLSFFSFFGVETFYAALSRPGAAQQLGPYPGGSEGWAIVVFLHSGL